MGGVNFVVVVDVGVLPAVVAQLHFLRHIVVIRRCYFSEVTDVRFLLEVESLNMFEMLWQ